MLSDVSAQAGYLQWQNNSEFGHLATQAVVSSGAFVDKALPRAMQGENDLLVLFLDRDKTHVGSADSFADDGRIRGVVLAAFAAHAVRGNELGGHQFDGVSIIPE